MSSERRKEELGEMIKNAVSGYAVTVLSIVCFMLSLVIITFIVRLVVGASTGTGV